jgi:sarcosine oxidase
MDFDVIVCGLGAMGSAASYHLSRAGLKVLGLDRFQAPHDRGSSHGKTRIIREAYFEHPSYVPLVQRAYVLWAELESKSARKLLLQTGGLMIGPADGVLVTGAKKSAEEHELAHRVLSRSELQTEYPAFKTNGADVAVWEPRAGIVFPELGIQTHLELAAQNGADLKFNEKVVRWEPEGQGVRVLTAAGAYTARRLLLSVGSWLNLLVPELRLPLAVERQVLFWFDLTDSFSASASPARRSACDEGGSSCPPSDFTPDRFPIFIWENEPHKFFYGFPDLGDGFKIGVHHQGQITTADRLNRDVGKDEIEAAGALLKKHIPAAAGTLQSAVVCMYTNTPDEHFFLDYHPVHRQVVIASPCSGHGFKFSPVIGEIAARLLKDEPPQFDLGLFRIGRFAAGAGAAGPARD